MTSHLVTQEVFTSLTSAMTSKDRSRTQLTDSVLSGKKKLHVVQLNTARFLCGVARGLPRFWIRYPKHFTLAVMGAMMDVLDVNPAVTKVSFKRRLQPTDSTRQHIPPYLQPIKNGGIPPWHLLAFVDPECQWLKAWVHSHHGRSAFISLLNCRKE